MLFISNANSLLICSCFVLACPLLTLAEDKPATKAISMELDAAIKWLPSETETLVVAEGPFKLVPDAESRRSMEAMWRTIPTRMFSALANGKYYELLLGRQVVWALSGSRKFAFPSGLGSCPYEGCEILILDSKFEKQGKSLIEVIREDASEVVQIAGHRVAQFEQRWSEQDVMPIFVSQPTDTTLLVASNREFLAEVLTRMSRGGESRALPSDLPEWKQLEANTRCWAIRHYDARNAANDFSSPLNPDPDSAWFQDKDAVGAVFFVGKHKNALHVRYLSKNEHVDGHLATLLSMQLDMDTFVAPKVRKLAGSGFELTHSLKTEIDVAEVYMKLTILLGFTFAA